MSGDLLRVENLRTHFHTQAGVVRAVDGVDLNIAPGRTLGVVGESGCGKSVTALSVMRLIDHPGRIEAGSKILFGERDLAELEEDELQRIRGNDISMIFQEPMTSLNPVYTVGDQIAEAVQLHQRVGAHKATERAVEMMRLVGERGPVEAIFNSPQHPYTEALLHSIPVLGMTQAEPLKVIRGMVPSPLNWPGGCRFATRCDYTFDRCLKEDPPLLEAGVQRSACWLCDKGPRNSTGLEVPA